MEISQHILEFARRHLEPYTVRGDELIPEHCPICHGGESGDKYTFALNLTEGVYVCKRGTCGVRGRFEELSERFGERADLIRPAARAKKQFVLPDVQQLPLTDTIIRYFSSRKIRAETLNAFSVSTATDGSIIFPFYKDGELSAEYIGHLDSYGSKEPHGKLLHDIYSLLTKLSHSIDVFVRELAFSRFHLETQTLNKVIGIAD